MLYAIYSADGTILKAIEGPSIEWAQLFAGSLDCQAIEVDHTVEGRSERVDVEASPPALVSSITPPTPDELRIDILRATQRRLDDFAQSRGYDGILSATSYQGSTDVQFAAEAAYAVEIRDQTWRALYGLLAEVQSGARPLPAGYADIEPLLPVPAWPEETR